MAHCCASRFGPAERPHDDTRAVLFRRVADHVRYLERQAGHRRPVILGDFNASPFEPSVMGASGFHAIGVRRVGKRHTRAVRRAGQFDFFYNLMWRMYGTDPAGDAGAGTYFYRGYEAVAPFWHIFDADGLPDADTASDHLPVTFVLS